MTKPVIVKKTKKEQMLIAIIDAIKIKLNSTNSIYYIHDAIFSFSERMM